MQVAWNSELFTSLYHSQVLSGWIPDAWWNSVLKQFTIDHNFTAFRTLASSPSRISYFGSQTIRELRISNHTDWVAYGTCLKYITHCIWIDRQWEAVRYEPFEFCRKRKVMRFFIESFFFHKSFSCTASTTNLIPPISSDDMREMFRGCSERKMTTNMENNWVQTP